MEQASQQTAFVLDASALVALLCDEEGAQVVEDAMSDETTLCYAHAVNLYEVYYDALRRGGEERAEQAVESMRTGGVVTRLDLDTDFWQDASRIKAFYAPVSLADTFCLALARRLGATALTADHHELDHLVDANLCSIEFIR